MTNNKSTINLKDRAVMSNDPFYKQCALAGHHNHICDGRITFEHTIIYGGKSYQKQWSIIPLCEKAHAVNKYQDAGTMKKEMNVWVALNRATDKELLEISKAENYIHKRNYLNSIYGIWSLKIVEKVEQPKIKNIWHLISKEEQQVIDMMVQHYKENEGVRYNRDELIHHIILSHYREIENLQKNFTGSGINY